MTDRPRLTALAQALMAEVLRPGDTALDATVGNGHDTAFLAECVRPGGTVWGLDIQAKALATTARRVQGIRGCHIELRRLGHERLAELATGALQGAMFNLGYLPGGDKAVTTTAAHTCTALGIVAERLAPGGRCTVLAYVGHPGGGEEAAAVLAWCKSLPADRFHWRLVDPAARPVSAPRLHVITRLGSRGNPTGPSR